MNSAFKNQNQVVPLAALTFTAQSADGIDATLPCCIYYDVDLGAMVVQVAGSTIATIDGSAINAAITGDVTGSVSVPTNGTITFGNGMLLDDATSSIQGIRQIGSGGLTLLVDAPFNISGGGVTIGANATSATLVGVFGNRVIQQTAHATTTGFTAGSGTASKSDSTFTGGSGASAYTVGDLVLALKNFGIIAA